MSPKLLLNHCVTHIVGVDPDELGSELFWRGDAVVMRFESQDDIHINCQNVNISMTSDLEVVLRDAYMSGHLEQTLTMNESLCKQEYQFHHALI
jgi:glutathionyl-hydroquinone reductase